MSLGKYYLINIVETLLRMMPFPHKLGVIKVGNPDRHSPVFLTCNFHLTVERVKRALQGLDCYLLVANSRGINIWCAAAGGHFTHHDVISILKTSDIEDLVDHRTVILPQLAATGVEAKLVREKAGWKVIWGPVYATEIPAFVRNEFKKTPDMRQVAFPWQDRLEAAVAWAFPVSLILALVAMFFWRSALVPIVLLTWGVALAVMLTFPWYSRLLGSEDKSPGKFFTFELGGLQIIVWGIVMLSLVGYTAMTGNLVWGLMVRWGIAAALIVLTLTFDIKGFTPIYKASLMENSSLKITLDKTKCKGAGFCDLVCPQNCFEVDKKQHTATMPGVQRCIRCGACIVQCPFDALWFETSDGEVLSPDTVRTFKLNLMGKRQARLQ